MKEIPMQEKWGNISGLPVPEIDPGTSCKSTVCAATPWGLAQIILRRILLPIMYGVEIGDRRG